MKKKKSFVIDTNVLLHDSTSLHKFSEHDVIIPFPVIEELDKFKNGNESINYHARNAINILSEVCEQGRSVFNGGTKLGNKLGKIRIILPQKMHESLNGIFTHVDIDAQIINIAYCLMQEQKSEVIIVSKDAHLRIRANAVGVPSQDFLNDKIKDESILNKPVRTVEVDTDLIKKLHGSNDPVEFTIPESGMNEFFVLKGGNTSALAMSANGLLYKVPNKRELLAMGISPKNAEQSFAAFALMNPDISIVTIKGSAGTGKTILSLAYGLEQIKKGLYDNLLFTRQIVSVGERELGYLPGDQKEKMAPFMAGMHDNLAVIKEQGENNSSFISDLISQERLVAEPIAFIRGRSFHRSFLVVDEVQNMTPHEVKTVVTRAALGTKIILIGDIDQIDTKYLNKLSNGLSYFIDRFNGESCYTHINLVKGERSPLATLAGELL
ncbi:MAG: PhoH family protein [Candidatus Paceibacteria bacterium]